MTLRNREHAQRAYEHLGLQPAECAGCGDTYERRKLTRDGDDDLMCSGCMHGHESDETDEPGPLWAKEGWGR